MTKINDVLARLSQSRDQCQLMQCWNAFERHHQNDEVKRALMNIQTIVNTWNGRSKPGRKKRWR